jgi:hypothetical protein
LLGSFVCLLLWLFSILFYMLLIDTMFAVWLGMRLGEISIDLMRGLQVHLASPNLCYLFNFRWVSFSKIEVLPLAPCVDAREGNPSKNSRLAKAQGGVTKILHLVNPSRQTINRVWN